VVDILHGVTISDPYRWLENRQHPATVEWIRQQRTRFDAYFERLGELDGLKARILEYLDVETIDQIGRVRDRYFFRKRLVGQQQPAIYYMKENDHVERVLVDPSPLGPFASVGIHRVAPDGRLIAYELKQGGEHSKEIHVVDSNSGEMWPEFLARGLARGFAFRTSADGFYYCHEFVTDGHETSNDYQIRCHQRGSAWVEDRTLFSIPREKGGKLLLRASNGTLSAVYCHTLNGTPSIDLWVATEELDDIWTPVCCNVPAPFAPFFHRGRLFALTSSPNGNFAIAELDPADGAVIQATVPSWRSPIRDCAIAGDRIFVTYVDHWKAIVREWSLDGKFCGEVPLDAKRTWALLPNHSPETEELFLSSQSFTEPPTLHCYRTSSQQWSTWSKRSSPRTQKNAVTHSFTYRSKDGTSVDLALVGTEHISQLRDRPIIMTAYGASGIPMTPQFSVFVLVMLELGFSFALPAIRGGGEHGREWHDAARGRSKQRAFDDFIAAAEWLCAQGFTSPGRLAIFGGSFSGLLVGTVICQNPELFRAALCIAPLLDMLRYHLFDRASVWASEYGTAESKEDFDVLRRYSPYHQVQDDVAYPAILFVSGDQDSRCNPAHVRKMAARLQGRNVQDRAIIVDHSTERGHAPNLPIAVKVDALAHRIAFFCNELNIKLTLEEMHARTRTSDSIAPFPS
jgi:prolyl oligopeptidase